MINLPANWSFTKIKVIADLTTGDLDANAAQSDGIYPFFTCSDEISKINNYAFNQEAILLAGNGSFGVKWFEGKFNAYQRTYVITPTHIHGQYLYYYLYSKNSYFHSVSRGSTIKYLRIADIHDLDVPYPPLKEQKKIVDKIDELFSELDNGIEELKTAQKKLELYRQSLLKSAVEGGFSKEWRESQTEVSETGEQLLARILKERRERWEQEKLKEFADKGKNPPKNWQEKYPEPAQPDIQNLPRLPEGWMWASLDMLGEIVSGVAKGTKRSTPVPMREVPYLRVANVQRGYLDLTEIKTILATEKDINQLTLKEGDILFNEGGDRDKLGRGWVWKSEIDECIHQNHVFRCRLYESNFIPELISYHGNTFGKLWFERAGKQTTNLASINMGILKRFPVPVIPVLEQKFIFNYIQTKLDMIDIQLEQNNELIKNCSRQRTNILNQAFEGKLIPQNPNDEPAQVLLEYIQQQREAEALAKKVTTKTRVTKTVKKEVSMSNSILEILKNQSDWISGQDLATSFGLNGKSKIEEIEQYYEQLRTLSLNNVIIVQPDQQNNKQQDMIKIREKTNAS